MIVKLKENPPLERYKYANISGLDTNAQYRVIDVGHDFYRLINENGDPAAYPIVFFDIIDNSIDDDWVVVIDDFEDDECVWVNMEPKELLNFSYEDYFDYNMDSMNFFLRFLEKRNMVLVSNLAYCPIQGLKKHYTELLEKIDKRENKADRS